MSCHRYPAKVSAPGTTPYVSHKNLQLMKDIDRRLATLVSSGRKNANSAEQLLVILRAGAAIEACIDRNPSGQEAGPMMKPLNEAVELAKMVVRRRGQPWITAALQADVASMAYRAVRGCRAVLGRLIGKGGQVWPSVVGTSAFGTRMEELRHAIQQVTPGTELKKRFGPSSNTGELSSSSSSSAVHSSPRGGAKGAGAQQSRPARKLDPRVGREWRHHPRCAPVSPGALGVAARRPSARVDPRLCSLAGTGAVWR